MLGVLSFLHILEQMEYKNVSFTATLKIHPSYLQFIKYKRQTIDINSIRQHWIYSILRKGCA